MTLSPAQAAESLREIEKTARRSAEAREYMASSDGFILWGLIWVVGYAGTDFLTHQPQQYWKGINALWFVLVVIGVFGSAVLNRRRYCSLAPEAVAAGKSIGFRWGMTMLAVYVFMFATFAVMRPANPVAPGAFVPLIMAVTYSVYGIWRGLRFLYAGIAVAALTLGGWFYLPGHFLLWMAAVGGGALILVGLWLRKV